MSFERDFIDSVTRYRNKPSKQKALSIWNLYLSSFAPKRIFKPTYRSRGLERLKATIDQYSRWISERDEEYTHRGKNPFKKARKRWQRHRSAQDYKADPSIFNHIAKQLKSFVGLEWSQQDLIQDTQTRSLEAMRRRRREDYKAGKYYERSKEQQHLDRVKGQHTENTALQAVEIQDIVDYLQAADITINFRAYDFFRAPLTYNAYINMWERGVSSTGITASDRRRDRAERYLYSYFHYVATQDFNHIDASSRPVYAALNVTGDLRGAASSYGPSSFVIHNTVKRRSTFTPQDSFYLGKYLLSTENIKKLKRDTSFNPINEDGISVKEDILNDLRRILAEAETKPLKIPGLNINQLTYQAVIKHGLSAEAQAEVEFRIRGALHRIRSDGMGFQTKRVATFDTIENIISYLSDDVLIAIAEKIANVPPSSAGLLSSYVEVQVQGQIHFSKDIKKMCIDVFEVDTSDEESRPAIIENIKQFARTFPRITPYTIGYNDDTDYYEIRRGLDL